MVFERYNVIKKDFHCLQIKDEIKNRKDGCFDRFEKQQLEQLCHDLNEENQASQDYEDFVNTTIINAINTERTTLGRNVLIQLADTLGLELE